MDYVISPLLIYFINVVPGFVLGVGIPVLVCFGSWFIVFGALYWNQYDNKQNYQSLYDEKLQEKFKRMLLKGLKKIWIPVFFLVSIALIPPKKILIQMIVAHNLTYTNIDKAIKTGTDLKDTIKQDIIDIINGTKEEQ
jgi:hypothetical protein